MDELLHVARAGDWAAAQADGTYAIPDGDFIHLCRPEQLAGVLERFYAGAAGLVLLRVDGAGLDVRVEAAGDGAGEFPHLYAPLPVAAVTRAEAL